MIVFFPLFTNNKIILQYWNDIVKRVREYCSYFRLGVHRTEVLYTVTGWSVVILMMTLCWWGHAVIMCHKPANGHPMSQNTTNPIHKTLITRLNGIKMVKFVWTRCQAGWGTSSSHDRNGHSWAQDIGENVTTSPEGHRLYDLQWPSYTSSAKL